MSKKINPTVFLKAAKLVYRDITTYGDGLTCCEAITTALGIPEPDDYESLYASKEFKFFAKMFGSKRYRGTYWFGRPYKLDDGGLFTIPHPANQLKRVMALMAAYEEAKRLK